MGLDGNRKGIVRVENYEQKPDEQARASDTVMGRSRLVRTATRLAVGAAVVEHCVAEDLEAGGLQRRDAPLQRVLAAVRAVQVVQVPRPAISTARVRCLIDRQQRFMKSPCTHAGSRW